MDVAGPFVGRLDQDFVDQFDNRRFLGHLGRFAVVGLQPFEHFHFFLAVSHHGGDGFAANAEMLLDEPGDFAGTGQHWLNVRPVSVCNSSRALTSVPVATRVPFLRQRHDGPPMHQLERTFLIVSGSTVYLARST